MNLKTKMRLRGSVALLIMLLMFWAPFVVAVERLWREDGLTLQTVYGEWWKVVKSAAYSVRTGIRGRA